MIWDYDSELLITLCNECHDDYHAYCEKIVKLIQYDMFKHNVSLFDLGSAFHKLIEK